MDWTLIRSKAQKHVEREAGVTGKQDANEFQVKLLNNVDITF